MRPAPPRRDDDQDFLDALLDDVLRRLEDGQPASVDALSHSRPHLRQRVEQVVRLAREVVIGSRPATPAIRGYSDLREIGRGGMGTVYLARQDRLAGRLVALKVLSASAALSQRGQERFIREAESLGRLRHPNVITVFDVVQSDGVLAYAMEWIDGRSLADLIERLRAASAAGSRITERRRPLTPSPEYRACRRTPRRISDPPGLLSG